MSDETSKDIQDAIFDYLGTIEAYQKELPDIYGFISVSIEDVKANDTEQIMQTLRHLIILMRVPKTRQMIKAMLDKLDDSDE